MENTLLDECKKSIANLCQELNGLFLRDGFVGLLLKVVLEIYITKLLNNIVIVVAFHDIKQLDNVRGFENFHNFYLRYQSCL